MDEENDNCNEQLNHDDDQMDSSEVSKPELNESNEDNVGDTVFSKHWMFQCLIKTLETINQESDSSDSPIELDSDIEEELCLLWDMSANEDVGKFLNDFKAIDLFEGIIMKTNSPRLAEISVGILANISSISPICMTMTNKEGFVKLILSLLKSSDTPFVLQLIRLILTALSNIEARPNWLSEISMNSTEFFTSIQFTLQNCLNCDVLKGLLNLIYKVFYCDESLISKWFEIDQDKECVLSIYEASKQIIQTDQDDIDCIDYFWLIMHLQSIAYENFILTYIKPIENSVFSLFKHYMINSFGETMDYIIQSQHRAGALAASLSIINELIDKSSFIKSQVANSSSLNICFKNLLTNCQENLNYASPEDYQCSYTLAREQLLAIISLIENVNSSNVQDTRQA